LVVSAAAFQDSAPKPEGGNATKKALSEGATASARTYSSLAIRLRHRAVNDAIPMLQPFSRLPNSLLTVPSMNTIVMRDYSANVRRMLKLLQNFDVPETGEVLVEPAPRPRRN